MRAVVVDSGQIQIDERPRPSPSHGEVLVRVRAAGLNRADLLQRSGLYPPPPGIAPDIPGLEFSGIVEELGQGVDHPAIGTSVMGIVAGGAQAEFVAVHATHCAAIPSGLDVVTAGGIPEAFFTAHDAMRTQALLVPGERVLVHAAGSGVGTAVIQIAVSLGCPVTGTARTESKLERARALGLQHGVVATDGIEMQALADLITSGGAPDVVIDLVGGAYVTADVIASAPLGRIVVVGTLAGGSAKIPLLAMMGKRLRMMGTMLRTRSIEEKASVTSRFMNEVGPFLTDRSISPAIENVFDFQDAATGYDLLASNTTFGKLILSVS
ncbi:MAG: NAD(P)H-quinone oxidoreductase [Acidimicrobiia bacterium]|nr:NAD(P)H-quinone oxidoreductase [Acidimicrobiia bacterium]